MEVKISASKKRMLHVATKLFQERGFSAATMRQLARELDIEAASIYSHFSSKEEILSDICFSIANEFFVMYHKTVNPNDSPVAQLESAIVAHMTVLQKHRFAASVFFKEWIFLSDKNKKEFKQLRYEYQQLFADIITKGIAANSLQKVDVKVTVFTILSALNASQDLVISKAKIDYQLIVSNITSILLNGLKK